MIERAGVLNQVALGAIAGLERRCVAADGGRLKLEWGALRTRPADAMRDLLWWNDGRLLGFLGIYGYRTGWFEVTGMVDPDHRRRGIARTPLQTARPLLRAAGGEQMLLVVPRTSSAGREFAHAFGMSYEHSEHALRLSGAPAEGEANAALSLRQAEEEDIPALSALYLDAFGMDEVDPDRLTGKRSRTLMIVHDGEVVGTVAASLDGTRAGVYGFVVAAALRGRGIGAQVLRLVCRDLFDAGVEYVDLDVEVKNDRALRLYTSVGFESLATDDYYELALS